MDGSEDQCASWCTESCTIAAGSWATEGGPLYAHYPANYYNDAPTCTQIRNYPFPIQQFCLRSTDESFAVKIDSINHARVVSILHEILNYSANS
jgi:hypothetical protein